MTKTNLFQILIFITLFLLPLKIASQDCKTKKEVEKKTGIVTIRTKTLHWFAFQKTIKTNDTTYQLILEMHEPEGNNLNVTITFTDGYSAVRHNVPSIFRSSSSASGPYIMTYAVLTLDEDLISTLRSRKVIQYKIDTGTKKTVTEKNAERIKSSLECILNIK